MSWRSADVVCLAFFLFQLTKQAQKAPTRQPKEYICIHNKYLCGYEEEDSDGISSREKRRLAAGEFSFHLGDDLLNCQPEHGIDSLDFSIILSSSSFFACRSTDLSLNERKQGTNGWQKKFRVSSSSSVPLPGASLGACHSTRPLAGRLSDALCPTGSWLREEDVMLLCPLSFWYVLLLFFVFFFYNLTGFLIICLGCLCRVWLGSQSRANRFNFDIMRKGKRK